MFDYCLFQLIIETRIGFRNSALFHESLVRFGLPPLCSSGFLKTNNNFNRNCQKHKDHRNQIHHSRNIPLLLGSNWTGEKYDDHPHRTDSGNHLQFTHPSVSDLRLGSYGRRG